MPMAWPERVAAVLMFAIAAAVFLLGAALNAASGTAAWIVAGALIWWHLCKMTVFPLWIVMRAADFALLGPQKRRRRVMVAPRS